MPNLTHDAKKTLQTQAFRERLKGIRTLDLLHGKR
jgi:hypothetical protein